MKKNVLLIGGSHGIGKALIDLVHDEYNIYVASRSGEDLNTAEITHIQYDVLDGDLDTTNLPDQLDGFIYCPGNINLKPFKMLSADTCHYYI